MFDLYVDFLGLRNADKNNITCLSVLKSNKNEKKEAIVSYEHIFHAIKNETQELDRVEKNLNKMEKKFEEEEEFVSFFTTTHL